MKINVLPLIAACVLTLCCLLTAGLYRMKTIENHRLQRQVNRLREHNLRLMSEYSQLRARMDENRAVKVRISYNVQGIVQEVPGDGATVAR